LKWNEFTLRRLQMGSQDRYVKTTPRLHWALLGPRSLASSRLHGYLIHEQLSRRGWETGLLYTPLQRELDFPLDSDIFRKQSLVGDKDIVVFQKLRGPRTQAALEILRERRVKAVFIDCDYPPKLQEARLSSITICSSETLANLYRAHNITSIVLPESYETLLLRNGRSNSSQPLTYVWFGSMDALKSLEVRWLRTLLHAYFPNSRLIVIAEEGKGDYRWDYQTSWQLISACDIAVITGNDSIVGSCKSPNRIIQAMALSLPVVAFPAPSYQKIIRHGRNGFLCKSDEEWIHALTSLKSAVTRATIGSLGYRYAKRYYNPNKTVLEWENMFGNLSPLKQ